MSKTKLTAAKWLYRWGLAMGIIGTIFTVLTFVGVYFQVIGPALIVVGVPSWAVGFLLAGLSITVILGFGFFLDHAAKFWTAQATVGTTRNQYLVDALYQKELLLLKYIDLPMQRALLHLLEQTGVTFHADPILAAKEEREWNRLTGDLRTAIRRTEETVGAKRWEIEPDERVY